MRILLITSEWPTKEHPEWVPFLTTEINELIKAGITIDVFNFRGKKNPFNYFKAWFVVHKFVNLVNYDLIHAEWGQNGLLAFPKKIPLVTTFRGSDLEGILNESGSYTFTGRILQLVSKLSAKLSDEIVLVSESLSRFISRDDYHVIPVCLNLDLFKPNSKITSRRSLGFEVDEFLILFASNPSRPEKRFWLAKSAVDDLSSKCSCRLVVAHDIPHESMPLYFNACDVLILPSTHEGSPTIVFEALACNLPIVASNVGDVAARIESIKGCYICKNDSPKEFSDLLLQVFLNGSRINGRDSVIRFDKKNFAYKMKGVYQSAIQKSKGLN